MRGIARDLWRKRQAVSEHSPKCRSAISAYQVLFIVCGCFFTLLRLVESRMSHNEKTPVAGVFSLAESFPVYANLN